MGEATRPDWLVAGNQAVILQPWERGALRAETVTIERVLKRDVVLSNGVRFNADRLQASSHSGWGPTTYLVSLDDPQVPKVRRAIRESNARGSALGLADDYRRGSVTARQVADAWLRLADIEADADA